MRNIGDKYHDELIAIKSTITQEELTGQISWDPLKTFRDRNDSVTRDKCIESLERFDFANQRVKEIEITIGALSMSNNQVDSEYAYKFIDWYLRQGGDRAFSFALQLPLAPLSRIDVVKVYMIMFDQFRRMPNHSDLKRKMVNVINKAADWLFHTMAPNQRGEQYDLEMWGLAQKIILTLSMVHKKKDQRYPQLRILLNDMMTDQVVPTTIPTDCSAKSDIAWIEAVSDRFAGVPA